MVYVLFVCACLFLLCVLSCFVCDLLCDVIWCVLVAFLCVLCVV